MIVDRKERERKNVIETGEKFSMNFNNFQRGHVGSRVLFHIFLGSAIFNRILRNIQLLWM